MNDQSYHEVDLSKYSFLVTGGAGFIGSHIVEYLIKFNAGKVIILDNLSTGYLDNITSFLKLSNVEFVNADIRDLTSCIRACENIDYVLHQAALGSIPRSVQDPITTHEVNATGFVNMLQAIRETNVKRMVYASSSSVYGDSKTLPKIEKEIGVQLSPYAVSKRVNELYARVFADVYGIEIVGLRYFNIFGPRQNPNGPYAAAIPIFIDAILSEVTPKINGDGEQTRDFTFVKNAVQANMKALFAGEEASGKVFNVACGNTISINMLFDKLKQVIGSDVKPVYGPARTGDVRDSLASIDETKKVLGYEVHFGLDEGIQETVNWFKNKKVNS